MTAMEVRGSRGADRSKKLLRTLEYASDIKNFRVSADGTLVKRPKSRLLYKQFIISWLSSIFRQTNIVCKKGLQNAARFMTLYSE